MQITEINILPARADEDRVLAYCSVVFDDCFIVRDMKIIQADDGRRFISFPSRKLQDRCRCGRKNVLEAHRCTDCGTALDPKRGPKEQGSNRRKLYADIAHPITGDFREYLEAEILAEYDEELERIEDEKLTLTHNRKEPDLAG